MRGLQHTVHCSVLKSGYPVWQEHPAGYRAIFFNYINLFWLDTGYLAGYTWLMCSLKFHIYGEVACATAAAHANIKHSVVEEPPAQATLSMYSIFLKISSTLCSGNFFSLNLSNNANYLFQFFKYLFWCPEPDLVLFSISVPVPLQKASSTAVIPKHCSPYSTQLGQFLLFSLIIGEGDRLFHI